MKTLSKGYKRYALILLTTVYALSFMDRIMIGILMESMKKDLSLSDTQLGFLTGLAFALFYATLGIPIARWADRGSRTTIASLAMATWGGMVMLSSVVGNFFQLALVRMGAAVGEAGVFPPAYSLLGDYFNVNERTRALSIYMAGVSLSVIVSSVYAGWVNEHFGWRMAFLIVGIPGFVAAVVIKLTLHEPRQQLATRKPESNLQIPLWTTVRILWQQHTYRYLVLAITFANVVSIGLGQWFAVFFIRQYQVPTSELGIWLGLIGGTAGALATWFAGHIAHQYFSHRVRDQLRICALGVALIFPCILFMTLVGEKVLALVTLIPITALSLFFYGPIAALMQRLVSDGMRATAAAFSALILNFIGMGIGPQLVGILSDYFSPMLGAAGLSVALIIVATSAFCSAYFFWRAGNCVNEDLAETPKDEFTNGKSHDSAVAHLERMPEQALQHQ